MAHGKSSNWTANQTWGIEDYQGEGRYIRHVSFTGPKSEVINTKTVYDYIGPV
ncbi:hypothetical protein CPB83DRAFT_896695 [Crepidotus variabilis]|uniref:Uncharacterized protein n=1 Tax=Crepidotus variabilis TaxID=179855 RepID=A0A9P6EB02_9AGAR|nr:hypothetical protein CPB83DRAFT_896695 [Crepidotus variabilis]